MFIYKSLRSNIFNKRNEISHILKNNRYLYQTNNLNNVSSASPKQQEDKTLDSLINKYDDKLVFNSVIESKKLKYGYRKNRAIEQKHSREYKQRLMQLSKIEPIPVVLQQLNKDKPILKTKKETPKQKESTQNITQFPFGNVDKIQISEAKHETNDTINIPQKEIEERNTLLGKEVNWMTDYENYDDTNIEDDVSSWKLNYGTPDPNSAVSKVPCGGCGALLHCKDTAIPGYIPSEIFKMHDVPGGQKLTTLICQRCHFLKEYNMALQVRVSPEDYPKILEKIKENKNALAILMVDLLDFPCSIWPNIIDIIGTRRPVVVVGNKVDLLPQDSKGYLNHITKVLEDNINKNGLEKANIKHVALISAKTGYGVEELITKLHNIWEYKGDVYLIGCTNVGKSTLFNVLLQSDYCKVQAIDLVQRATTSLWPGTTLNLLKFPILRPSGWRKFVRTKRLISLRKLQDQENKLRKMQLSKTQNPAYASLIGHIERTFSQEEPINEETLDMFQIQGHENSSGKVRIGINEKSPEYKLSKWCYDTPGVVQPDQILHLLTTDELMLTLPKQIIQPRTFSIKTGYTIFIAGLGRLDYIEGRISTRFTVFASHTLPITICPTEEADKIYNELLGTELFQVPLGSKERLQKWPQLESSEDIHLTGINWDESCADIVLSSAGWISVSPGEGYKCVLKAWTPEKRGIYIRDSLLRKAVTLRGPRVRNSPAYKKSKLL